MAVEEAAKSALAPALKAARGKRFSLSAAKMRAKAWQQRRRGASALASWHQAAGIGGYFAAPSCSGLSQPHFVGDIFWRAHLGMNSIA